MKSNCFLTPFAAQLESWCLNTVAKNPAHLNAKLSLVKAVDAGRSNGEVFQLFKKVLAAGKQS